MMASSRPMPDDAPVTMAYLVFMEGSPAAGDSPPPRNECRQLVRLHHDLDAVVLLVAEGAIHVGGLVEADPVRDDERGIDLAPLDAGEQQRQVAVHVGLAHLEGQALGERGAE